MVLGVALLWGGACCLAGWRMVDLLQCHAIVLFKGCVHPGKLASYLKTDAYRGQ